MNKEEAVENTKDDGKKKSLRLFDRVRRLFFKSIINSNEKYFYNDALRSTQSSQSNKNLPPKCLMQLRDSTDSFLL